MHCCDGLICITELGYYNDKKVSCQNSSSYNNSTQNVGEIEPLGGLKYIGIITAHKMLMKLNPQVAINQFNRDWKPEKH